MVPVKIKTDLVIRDIFGLYSWFPLSDIARSKKAIKIISVIILNAKALPVIKGKSIVLDTIKGTKGIRKTPNKTIHFKILFVVIMDYILPEKA
jgi:hypothetical protein